MSNGQAEVNYSIRIYERSLDAPWPLMNHINRKWMKL